MLPWLKAVLLAALLGGVALQGAGCAAVAVKLVDEVDATVSKLSQSDCALVRVIHGMDVCRNSGSHAVLPSAYCYRTWAASTATTAPTPVTAPSSARPPAPRPG